MLKRGVSGDGLPDLVFVMIDEINDGYEPLRISVP